MLTNTLTCTVLKSWLIIAQIFASDRKMPHLMLSLGVIPYTYIAINDVSLKLYSLGYIAAAERIGVSSATCVLGPESYRIR